MKKIFILMNIIILASIMTVFAIEEAIVKQAETIIQQRISCNELTSYQLEILGDYFMEQMHPGELHEIMDERLGGEGSENLKQVHINMGQMFYCGQRGAMSMNMMNMMMGRNYGMMGYGSTNQPFKNNSPQSPSNWLFNILIFGILVLLIIILIKQIQK